MLMYSELDSTTLGYSMVKNGQCNALCRSLVSSSIVSGGIILFFMMEYSIIVFFMTSLVTVLH